MVSLFSCQRRSISDASTSRKFNSGNWVSSSVPDNHMFETRIGFFPRVDIKMSSVMLSLRCVMLQKRLELRLRFPTEVLMLRVLYYFQNTWMVMKTTAMSLASHSSACIEDAWRSRTDKPPFTSNYMCNGCMILFVRSQDAVVTCDGPDARNIHGIDESVSLESLRIVTAAIALFILETSAVLRS